MSITAYETFSPSPKHGDGFLFYINQPFLLLQISCKGPDRRNFRIFFSGHQKEKIVLLSSFCNNSAIKIKYPVKMQHLRYLRQELMQRFHHLLFFFLPSSDKVISHFYRLQIKRDTHPFYSFGHIIQFEYLCEIGHFSRIQIPLPPFLSNLSFFKTIK
jgi:hypothetical protein